MKVLHGDSKAEWWNMPPTEVNRAFDRVVRPHLYLAGRYWSSFRFIGHISLIQGALLLIILGVYQQLSVPLLILLVVVDFATCIAVLTVTGIVDWEPSFYNCIVVVSLVTSGLAWMSDQSVAAWLDVTLISLGSTIIVGKLACFMAGCCHGRPSHFGVCYRAEHADAGFTAQLVGVRLFPIQLFESVAALIITVVGCGLMLDDHVPGAAAAWFIASYCPARFVFELARWPPNYRYKSGLSPYQWISVASVLLLGCLELAGILPFRLWHFLVLVLLLLVAVGLTIERQLGGTVRELNHPGHLAEVASVLERNFASSQSTPAIERNSRSPAIPVFTTSLGLRISASKTASPGGDVYHYAFSSSRLRLTEESANWLAKAIVRLNLISGQIQVVPGSRGVFHLLIYSGPSSSS